MDQLKEHTIEVRRGPSRVTLGYTLRPIPLQDLLNDLEAAVIIEALKASHGVRAQAAYALDLNRTTLVMKIKKYKIGGIAPTNTERSKLRASRRV